MYINSIIITITIITPLMITDRVCPISRHLFHWHDARCGDDNDAHNEAVSCPFTDRHVAVHTCALNLLLARSAFYENVDSLCRSMEAYISLEMILDSGEFRDDVSEGSERCVKRLSKFTVRENAGLLRGLTPFAS